MRLLPPRHYRFTRPRTCAICRYYTLPRCLRPQGPTFVDSIEPWSHTCDLCRPDMPVKSVAQVLRELGATPLFELEEG